jgi:hypothetical protein
MASVRLPPCPCGGRQLEEVLAGSCSTAGCLGGDPGSVMALEDQLIVRVPTLSEGTNFRSSSHPTEERNSPQIDQICPQTVASAWVADAVRARSAALRSSRLTRWFASRGMIMDLSCSKYSGSRESKKRRPTVLPAHSVHLARHDHGLELLKVLRISTSTP